MRRSSYIPDFLQRIELYFFPSWRRQDAYMSSSVESISEDSVIAVSVLPMQVWNHCYDEVCTAWYNSCNDMQWEKQALQKWCKFIMTPSRVIYLTKLELRRNTCVPEKKAEGSRNGSSDR